MEKQLNVWIDEQMKEALTRRAQQKALSVKQLIQYMISQEVAEYQAEIMEKQALPMIRDLVQSELRKALDQHLGKLQEDFHTEIVLPMKKTIRQSNERTSKHISERIAALSVRTVRDGSINRHLIYAHLAKSHGSVFAREAYEHAKEKAIRELEARSAERSLEEDE